MTNLAINGGRKVITRSLSRWPIWDEREEQALLGTLRKNWWHGDYDEESNSQKFERVFRNYIGTDYGLGVSSGTMALVIALKATGVGPGDEVLTPALSFYASATCILLANAVPIFVDVAPESYNISPEAMEAAITDRTKAAVVVHNGGYPADMDAIMEIAKKHDLMVIEDCSHAHGSEWRGRRVGSIGHLGAFSIMAGKLLAAPEGGIVLTNNEELIAKVCSFQDHGAHYGPPIEARPVPYNLRLSEFHAALVLVGLSRLDEQIKTRERNFTYLAKGLKEIDGIRVFDRDPRVTRWSTYYWNFKYNQGEFDGIPRDKFLEAVNAEGAPISVGAHGVPVYQEVCFASMNFGRTGCPLKCPLYGEPIDYTKVHCPEAERIYKTESLSISHENFLGEKENMDLILEAIRKVRANTDELRK
ncbi:L-glutamine:2-deoxy-scyllo-inosose aminotransferase [subsurface metagenome]